MKKIAFLSILTFFFVKNVYSNHWHVKYKTQNDLDSQNILPTLKYQPIKIDKDEAENLVKTKFNYRTLGICFDKDYKNLKLVKENSFFENENCVAIGRYANAVNKTGWGILEIETFNFEPELQAYCAGYIEGYLTQKQIYYNYLNTISDMCENQKEFCARLRRYLFNNLNWIKKKLQTVSKTNIYWKQVNLTYTQLTGISHGFNGSEINPSVSFDINEILLLQMSGDLFDLTKFFKLKNTSNDDVDAGHCTALVKITDENKDLLVSHVSMSSFNTMNRVLKLYKFAYDKAKVPGNAYSFSSYAGVLTSSDDYTLTSAGLLTMETTISVFNKSLFSEKYIKSKNQLSCWVRSIIANQLAKTGSEWVRIFAKYNSGTYNNQWMVVDYKLFKPNNELPSNDLIWILEQLPGYTQKQDVTWFLRKYRYWPSYNIPFLTKISKISGFQLQGEKNDWFKWGSAPRAKILERDHNKVQNLSSLFKLMRYNDYTHDEFSKCKCNPPYTAEAAISTRGDLNPANGTYELPGMGHRNHGSIDYKGTNYKLFKKLQFQAVGGPTYNPLPPFDWSKTDIVAKHYGQPLVWKFEPFITEWETNTSVILNDNSNLY